MLVVYPWICCIKPIFAKGIVKLHVIHVPSSVVVILTALHKVYFQITEKGTCMINFF